MLVLFAIATAVVGLAVFQYIAKLLRQLPGSSDALVLDLREDKLGQAMQDSTRLAIRQPLPSPCLPDGPDTPAAAAQAT